MSKPFDVVVACDLENGIGKDNDLPWHLPGDLRHFARLTTEAPEGMRNAVIMGRKTWESVPVKYKPLAGRLNVVLSRSAALELPEGVRRAGDLDEALAIDDPDVDRVFVVGGVQIYAEALRSPRCRWIYLTRVLDRFDCDAFFPDIAGDFERAEVLGEGEDNGVAYRIETWQRAS